MFQIYFFVKTKNTTKCGIKCGIKWWYHRCDLHSFYVKISYHIYIRLSYKSFHTTKNISKFYFVQGFKIVVLPTLCKVHC